MLNNISSDDKWQVCMERNRHVADSNYYLIICNKIYKYMFYDYDRPSCNQIFT